jgi:hypothetical protein
MYRQRLLRGSLAICEGMKPMTSGLRSKSVAGTS